MTMMMNINIICAIMIIDSYYNYAHCTVVETGLYSYIEFVTHESNHYQVHMQINISYSLL